MFDYLEKWHNLLWYSFNFLIVSGTKLAWSYFQLPQKFEWIETAAPISANLIKAFFLSYKVVVFKKTNFFFFVLQQVLLKLALFVKTVLLLVIKKQHLNTWHNSHSSHMQHWTVSTG